MPSCLPSPSLPSVWIQVCGPDLELNALSRKKKKSLCLLRLCLSYFLVLKFLFFPHKMKVIINDFKTVHRKQILAASYQSLETISLKHFTLTPEIPESGNHWFAILATAGGWARASVHVQAPDVVPMGTPVCCSILS